MVTTRGQSREPSSHRKVVDTLILSDLPPREAQSSNEEDDIFHTPAAEPGYWSEKADMEELFYTPAAKRQKSLPVRGRQSKLHQNTRPVVEIPSLQHVEADTAIGGPQDRVTEGKLAKDRRQQDDLRVTRKRQSDHSLVQEEVPVTENAVHSISESIQGSTAPFTNRRHIRLSSSNSVKFKTMSDLDIPEPAVVKEDDSSDDDAPEVVTRTDASKITRDKEREAQKAANTQQSASRKKRKEKDTILKQQAVAARKKRKRGSKEPEDLLILSSHTSASIVTPLSEDEAGVKPDQRPRPLDPQNLPEMLPLEYLQDEEHGNMISDFLSDSPKTSASKKPTLLKIVGEEPRDRVQGDTTYKVLRISNNPLLAPKASTAASTSKEAWLAGRLGRKISAQRQPCRSGFLKART